MSKEIRISLSLSLNAPDDEIRSTIMPVNRKYNISSLMKAIENYPHPPKSYFTIEYVLLKGINDSLSHARKLAGLLKSQKRRFKVNLINFNPFEGCEFEPVSEEKILSFQEELLKNRISTTIRKRKGAEISAACGQLGAQAFYKIEREVKG